MKNTKKCLQCEVEFTKIVSEKSVKAGLPKYCSLSCKGVYQSIHKHGSNNSNFGKKWSIDNKEKQSLLIKSKVDDDYRQKAGSANRGKKFDKNRINSMHDHRSRESYVRSHNEDTRKLIGLKSKAKFTAEFKLTMRRHKEEAGVWIPLELKTDWELYKAESNWIDKMFSHITDIKQLSLLYETKVFHYKNNRTGIVRDHLYSRYDGFIHRLFPEILRHPANCQLIPHNLNAKKGSKSSLTIDELFAKINDYHAYWQEHQICLEKIASYKNGDRWQRKEASE